MPGTVDWAPVAAALYVAAGAVLTAVMAGYVIWLRSRWERAMVRLSRRMARRAR